MSWIQGLYDTYEQCAGAPQFATDPLMPMCHVPQKAHIEVVIDVSGEFRSARVLQRNEQSTPVPCTEDSASRTNNDAPHALCDKLQYCASDYPRIAIDWRCGSCEALPAETVALWRGLRCRPERFTPVFRPHVPFTGRESQRSQTLPRHFRVITARIASFPSTSQPGAREPGRFE